MIKKFVKGKVAVFIDAANILYSQQTLGWEVDYKNLIKYFNKNFTLIFIGFYYGQVKENQGQERFFQMLIDRGYTLRTKPVKYIRTLKGTVLKGNLDVELTLDMSQQVDKYDTAVLFSGDSDFTELAQFVKSKGKRIVVFSTRGHIAKELIQTADKYIPFEFVRKVLERKKSPRRMAGDVYSKKIVTHRRLVVKRDIRSPKKSSA